MTRAALYARLSRDRTGEETATARQLEDCRAFAAARGWDVAGEFTDADVSAYKRNVPRPGYDDMLAQLDGGQVDVVVAWKLDRLLRRVIDFETLWERCEAQGANIATVRDGIDTSTPMVGELLPRLMATFAQLESKNLSVRELRKHEETARKGHRSGGGHRPFGLSRDWSELVESEAQLVRDAADRILAGDSMYAIAAEWNAAGVRTPTGRQWTRQLLSAMLRSPRIAGLREHRGEIVAVGTWPAIVSPDVHERLRATFRARQRRGPHGRFLLSGKVRCATCGSTLVIRRRHTDKARFYGCEKVNGHAACGGVHVVAEPLEELVGEAVLIRLEQSPDALSAALEQRERADSTAADLEAIRADEAALEQLARDHFADRIIGRPEYLAAREALATHLEAARSLLAHQNGAGVLTGALGAPERIRERWETEGLDWRRSLVGALIDYVEVRPVGRGGNRRSIDVLAAVGERSTIVWRY